MRNMMEKGKILKTIGMNIAIVLLLAGCSQPEHVRMAESEPIGFAPLLSRSAVTALGEGDSFAVWARESSDGSIRMILSQEEVRCAANIWSYDNLRYWKTGATYDFYALYPYDTPNVELQNSGAGMTPQIVVRDFDARNALDLMAAEQTGIVYGGNPSPVVFTFRHMLSKVEIVGRIDPLLEAAGGSARIVSATFYGIPATGSCTVNGGGYGTWTVGDATTSDAPFCSSSEKNLTTAGESLFGELLPIPQTLSNAVILEIEYEYGDANYTQNRFSKSIRLTDAGVTEWKPATGYRYSFTIGNDYILFDTPQVVPWRSASGGIVTIE